MRFFDTETCGFHGPTVLIQHADGPTGEVIRHNVWTETIYDTLELIETFCKEGVCGFNLAFDWFHIAQSYTTLALLGERVGFDEHPVDHIDLYADCEPSARDGHCVKPSTALDLFLHARKGPYQSTMDRKNIRLKRVPSVLGIPLVEELNKRVPLKDIYFARQKDPTRRWQVTAIKKDGEYDKEFVHVELKFRPSSALKALAVDALGIEENLVLKFGDIGVPRKFNPNEVGWAPFAKALSSKDNDWWCKIRKGGGWREARAWPGVIKRHISHWAYDPKAIAYSVDDVLYLQRLYDYFGKPEPGDDDSILACMVGAVRWRGFGVDLDKLRSLRDKAVQREAAAPKHSEHVRKYVLEALHPTEQAVLEKKDGTNIKGSTKKSVLETLSRLKADCPDCLPDGIVNKPCETCKGTGEIPHPAGVRAAKCLDARKARFDRTMFNKLLQAERFHASAKVIGSLSGRMSGGDGMNALGIQHLKEVRKAFPLAFGGLELCGGDFASYEIAIMDADYDDPELRKQLLTCYICKYTRTLDEFDALECPGCKSVIGKCGTCGKGIEFVQGTTPKCVCANPTVKEGSLENTLRKIHGLFGMCLSPESTYEDILATKGKDPDLYDQGKRGVFSQGYGGNWNTLVNRLGIAEEVAKQAEVLFATQYQGIGRAKARNYEDFCSMRQPQERGQVYWRDPKEYAESLNGFRRYFVLENQITKILYDLANDPPEDWTQLDKYCVRRDRPQKVSGAARSAIFAAAFQIQSHNMRAAQNHRIQATGSKETKRLQCEFWDLQPVGIHKWHVQPFNVHDEIMCPALPHLKPVLKEKVDSFVKRRRSLIPLLKMDFSTDMTSWADK